MKNPKGSTDDPGPRLQKLNEYLEKNFPDFFAEARFQVGDDDYFLFSRFGQYLARGQYVAATHDVSARCGLFTHVLYEPNEFIECIEADGARLLPPKGTGIGFDDLLERLPWQRL